MSRPQSSARAHQDLRHLLARMSERRYPETLPSLASYWMRTVYRKGYERDEWQILYTLLNRELEIPGVQPEWRSVLQEIRDCIRDEGLLKHVPKRLASAPEGYRPTQDPETLVPYVVRLMNEWLPREVAQLLVDAPEDESDREGIPVLAAATALERLLRRECLSPESLEFLLQPGLFSPHLVYPADYEILRDVVLLFLGRTEGPAYPVLPATLLCAPSEFGLEFANAVNRARVVARPGGEELHVPVPPAQSMELLTGNRVRITSVVITMDGRWWRASALHAGEPDSITYRAVDHLHIDFSRDEPKLRIPWPEARVDWSGELAFPENLAFFGRRWRVVRWEQDAGNTWLTLASAGALPVTAVTADAQMRLKRSRPASVDIAWAALESGLSAALTGRSGEPVEQLRQEELIPLARSVHSLAEWVVSGRAVAADAFHSRLSAVAYHSSAIEAEYGRVPWSVLPKRVRALIQAEARAHASEQQLRETFAGVPAQVETAFPVLDRWLSRIPRAA
jgi:hypothetical protein